MDHWYGTKSEILLMVPICENSRSLPINWNGICNQVCYPGLLGYKLHSGAVYLGEAIWNRVEVSQYDIWRTSKIFNGIRHRGKSVSGQSIFLDKIMIKHSSESHNKCRFLDYLSKIRYCIGKMRLCLLDREKNRVQLINKSLDQSI